MKRILLTIAFAISLLTGYTQTSPDTTFKDVTGAYKVVTPTLSNPHKYNIRFFQVAVIPLDSVGKKHIDWGENVKPYQYCWSKNENPFTQKDVDEFESEFLTCKQSKDTSCMKTIKRKTYCRKRAWSDGSPGWAYELNYVGFTKAKKLIIVPFVIGWEKCGNYDYPEKCEEAKKREAIIIDMFIDKMVKEISIHKIKPQ